MGNKIAHLKLHTEYSLLEGVGKIEEYIEKVKKLEIDTLAITDVSMFGAIEFYKKCKKSGIKPIIGLEVFIEGFTLIDDYSLVLLAKNKNGYRNLSKLSSKSYSRFQRGRNKIKYGDLLEYSKDLYILSGGINSEIIAQLTQKNYSEAEMLIKKFSEDFGENFVVDFSGVKKILKCNFKLLEIVEKFNLKYVISNDIYYPNSEDAILKKIVNSIKEGKKISDENSKNTNENEYSDLYLKSYEELEKDFKDFPEDFFAKGVQFTNEIAEECNVDFEFNEFKFPKYNLPSGVSEGEYIRKIVFKGLAKKYLKLEISGLEAIREHDIKEKLKENVFENVVERIEYELDIIDKMGYNGYFIIVWDFIKYSKENGIYVGPGRGSAAGSLVAYALDITEIDPLQYNLIFERFLNPERISMPDIDVDFDQEQREQVIEYVLKKYGEDYVAHIITFGTLKARAAIRDVGRVLGIQAKKVDKIAKLIPFNAELQEALKSVRELRESYAKDEEVKMLIDYSIKLEGRTRHASVHAAGVVISKDVLNEEIPTYSDGKTSIVSTQYQMKELEDLGILKMDFLGLKNLTILRKTVENIEKTRNLKLKLSEIPLDNQKAYELMTKADTMGVFQCESAGIRNLMRKMKIEKFEDIIALLALYRPGPLRSGMVDDFIAAKNHTSEIKYPHESLKGILEETYGVILYQEQIMKIVSEMADYTLGEADELRRAIGKKIPEIMQQNREKFVKKSMEKGVSEKKANEIYDLVEKFGGYGFNKSHSAAYALIVYWTAYFKANYELEFFAAIMTTESYNLDRFSEFFYEAREKGIKVLQPSINYSKPDFSVENNAIRYGLLAIKGLGDGTVEEIVRLREKEGKNFTEYQVFIYKLRKLIEARKEMEIVTLKDALKMTKKSIINKKQIEILINSGALDDLKGSREQKLESLGKAIEWSEKEYRRKDDIEGMLFGNKIQDEEKEFVFLETTGKKNSDQKKYRLEKECLGVYLTGHPLDKKKDIISIIKHNENSELANTIVGKKMQLIGSIQEIERFRIKNNEEMLRFVLEDFSGIINVVSYPRETENFKIDIVEDKIVIVQGVVAESYGTKNLVLRNIVDINHLGENRNFKLYILIEENQSQEKSDNLKKWIKNNENSRGKIGHELYFVKIENGKKERIKYRKNINLEEIELKKLIKLIGIDKIRIT